MVEHADNDMYSEYLENQVAGKKRWLTKVAKTFLKLQNTSLQTQTYL